MRTEKRAHELTGSAGASRPSLRSGFTAYFVLSPVNGSFATVAGGTPRSIQLDRCATANLTPAPRRQDHTTSPYAIATLVSRSSRVHRISPRVRDDRERPSRRVRRPDSITDLPDSTSGIFLRDGMDGAIVSDVEVICPSGRLMEDFAALPCYAHLSRNYLIRLPPPWAARSSPKVFVVWKFLECRVVARRHNPGQRQPE